MFIIENQIFRCKVDSIFSVGDFKKGYVKANDRFHASQLWRSFLETKGFNIPENFIKAKQIEIINTEEEKPKPLPENKYKPFYGQFQLDFNPTKIFNKTYGDIFPLEEFLKMAYEGSIMDDDGNAREILNKDKKIMYNECFSPHEAIYNDHFLKEVQKDCGQLYIVWYNK